MRQKILIFIIAGFVIQSINAIPPKPPQGKRWVRNEMFSDEFNGTELDTSKWYDYHPTWNGRPPGIFLRSQVSVENGYMSIQGGTLEKDTVIGSHTFNVACGAVVSKSLDAWFGYYECRFKAARTTMSTTFWFSTRRNFDGPEACKDNYGLEWDVQECIGREGDFNGNFFAKGMHSNSHFWYRDCEGERHDYRATQVLFDTEELASDAFNTYGGWWKNESEASYYFNNGEAKSHQFYSSVKSKPFDQTMGMNLVSETYPFPWISLPTDEELNDDSRNTCYYDWVRAYVLVDADDPNRKGEDKEPIAGIKLYEENVNLSKELTELSASGVLSIPFTYMVNEDRELHIELRNEANDLIGDTTLTTYTGYANVLLDFELNNNPLAGMYNLKAEISPKNGLNGEKVATDKITALRIK